MKQEMTFSITDESSGILENINHYVNQMQEPLKIYNFHTSGMFNSKKLEIKDEKNRKLEHSCIPFNNGRHLYYAVTMAEPVRAGDSFTIKLAHPLDRSYFEATTAEKDGLFFWSINHCPMMECELLCTVNFADSLSLVHVIGAQPSTQSETRIFWRIKMTRDQAFNPHIVYRKK